MLGFRSTPYELGQLRQTLGLDKPLLLNQYVGFWSGIVHGTMGLSLASRVPVLSLALPRLVVTLSLVFYSALLSVIADGRADWDDSCA